MTTLPTPWAHPQHAVYFFVGYPSPARLRAMVSTMSASTVVTIAVDDIDRYSFAGTDALPCPRAT